MRAKYPRTMNLPWSDSASRDDVFWADCKHMAGTEVVVTEKLDGENTNIYGCSPVHPEGYFHARSLDTKHHPSRNWIKQLVSEKAYQIPSTYRICGENLYAHHSIFYADLPSYFFVFCIVEEGIVKSWSDTVAICEMLGLQTAPTLYVGPFDEVEIRQCWTGKGTFRTLTGPSGETCDAEGYVVRLASEYPWDQHSVSVAKYVRPNHVATDEHWMEKPVVPNLLKE